MVFYHFMYVEPKASLLFDLNSNQSLEYEWFMVFFQEYHSVILIKKLYIVEYN